MSQEIEECVACHAAAQGTLSGLPCCIECREDGSFKKWVAKELEAMFRAHPETYQELPNGRWIEKK